MEGKLNCDCQRVAVLSDIHSNVWALKACLTDARQEGADCFVLLGDYVSGLAAPVETMDMIYALQEKYPTCCIRGNRERYLLDHRSGVNVCAPGSNTGYLLYTYDQLREKDIDFFAGLPIFDTVRINGVLMEIAHATKEQDRYYYEKGDDRISGVVEQMEADYLLCGHSHKQYQHHEQGKTILNPGAVGLPKGVNNRAQYLLLGVKNGAVSCCFRQVDYDGEKMIRLQFRKGLVQTGKYWAISDLYSALTGDEYTKKLLQKMYECVRTNPDALNDEQIWQTAAISLGMDFTEEKVLAFGREIGLLNK